MSMPIGVGVVVDDQVFGGSDLISNIVGQLEGSGIPLVKYEHLPAESVIQQFGNAAFLLLDWKLDSTSPDDIAGGVSIPETLQQSELESKLKFLKSFHRQCFAPVFLFTNEDVGTVKSKLKDIGIYRDDGKDFIFVKAKSDLTAQDGANVVCETIEQWMVSSPVVQLVSDWTRHLLTAQSQMFYSFYEGSHDWPLVMAHTFKADDADPGEEMKNVLLRNLEGRLSAMTIPLDFADDADAFPHEECLSILEGMVCLPNESLSGKYGCGDIFLSQESGQTPLYKINIRCDCDFLHSSPQELFLLNGREVKPEELQEAFTPNQGFKREINSAYVFPINGGKCVKFKFNDFKRVRTRELPIASRIGRLTRPYITDIRQRHAQWLQREGFARIPKELIDHITTQA